ncbi:MAG: carbamoyltransferase HypF, partial [Planctomycetia bacterium]
MRAVARDAIDRRPPQRIATAFHRAVAAMIVAVCRRLRDAGAGDVVGLTGGVFQNAALVSLACGALGRAGFDVLVHERVPANDG